MKVVGILNITPDSFATPALAPENAAAAAMALIDEGADVLDVGAESTRPGAPRVSPEEEWRRLAPSLPAIVARAHASDVLVSLDTRHPETATRAIDAGVDWINDVTGGGPAMAKVVASSACTLVVMHSLSVPPDREHRIARDEDPVETVATWFDARRAELAAAGIGHDRIILDPGIGFGKSANQSLALLAGAAELRSLAPLLIGHSRKSFLKPLLPEGTPPEARDEATLALSAVLCAGGVDYVRVHAVARHRALLAAYGRR